MDLGDGFVEWLRDTFADDLPDDVLMDEKPLTMAPLLQQQQQQQLPDTALLIQQMLEPVKLEVLPQDDAAPAYDSSVQGSTQRGQGARQGSNKAQSTQHQKKPAAKNTKRYKSVAQKEAHKRYRERKRLNIQTMEQEVQAKLQLLQQLQAENDQLKSQVRVLETSVNCSTQIHSLMQLLDSMAGMNLQDAAGSTAADAAAVAVAAAAAAEGGASPTAGGDISPSTSSESLLLTSGRLAAADNGAAVLACSGSGVGGDMQAGGETLLHQRSASASSGSFYSSSVTDGQSSGSGQLQQLLGFQQQQQQCLAAGDRSAACSPFAAADSSSSQVQQQQQQQQLCNSWSGTSMCNMQSGPVLCNAASGTAAELGLAQSASIAAAAVAAAGMSPTLTGSPHAPGTSSCALQDIFADTQQQQQQQQQQLQNGMSAAAAVGAGGSCSTPAAVAAAGGLLAGAASTLEESMAIYKDFLRTASALMMAQEASDTAAAAAAVESQLDLLTRSTIARLQPFLVAHGQGMVYDWNSRNLETFQHQDAPDSLWPSVLATMKLSPEQQTDALACYRMFGMCLSRLVDKRLALTAQYKALQQQAETLSTKQDLGQQGQRQQAAAEQQKSRIHSMSMELLQSIAKSLAAYQSLDGVFAHSVTSIITGAQMAVACVHSYPFLPQWHKIVQELQQQDEWRQHEQQQALAAQMQQKPTRRSSRQSHRAGTQLGVQHVVKA